LSHLSTRLRSYRLERLRRALVDFNAALHLSPGEALIYQGRGTAWMFKGRMDEAIADFNAAIDRDLKIVWAYFNRGLALLVKA
jgi:tetratricopeptide (TPR) repeat protein